MIQIVDQSRLRGLILRPVFALTILPFFAASMLANAQTPSWSAIEAARSAMAAGVEAAKNGDLDKAAGEFRRAATLAPKVAASHAALGSILLAQNKFGEALIELNEAYSLDTSDISVDLNLGRAEASTGNFAEAVQLFRRALVASPPPLLTDAESIAFATALAANKENGEAESVLRSALARDPGSASLNDSLGTLLAKSNRFGEALPLFQRAISAEPSYSKAQYHLGVALLSLNRPQEALMPLQLAATAPEDSFDVELQLGRTFSALHQDAEALKHLHRAANFRDSKKSSNSLYALALALQASGDSKAALPLFDMAIKDHAIADGSALINDAIAHVQTGDTAGAFPLYERALQLGPDTATLREDFGVAYLQKLDLDHAIEQFHAGLAIESSNAHLHYDLGLAFKLKDDLTSAVPEFERSAQLDPTLPDPAYALGIIYMQQGNFAAAAANLKNATALQPENGDAWALLGSVLKDSGQPADAAIALERAIALEPDQPSLHVQLAAIESQAGQKDAAAAHRKIAADLSRAAQRRQQASFALKSGRALLDQNKLPEAIVQLNIAAQAESTLSEPHHLLADAYARQGRPADAAIERQRAAELDRLPSAANPQP